MPSTVIAHYHFDPKNLVLRIRFVSGMIYEYLNVPQQVFEAMKASTSKGAFLNKHIKGNYEFRKIDPSRL